MQTKNKNTEHTETPLMQQYFNIKTKYPGALLLFRVGDFYETFGEDAKKTSEILGIVLTKRANGSASHIELAGFPYHSLDSYLPKLVRAGQRVAICDQIEDPKFAKTIVKRDVTEVVTPGISISDKILDHKTNNFLASIFFSKSTRDNIDLSGIAFLDISTGEFFCSQGREDYIDKLIQGFKPAEVIYQKAKQKNFTQLFGNRLCTYHLDDWVFSYEYCYEKLLNHFGTKSLKGYGVEDLPSGIIAAGAILHYLAETRHPNIQHITSIARIEEEKYVWLDRATIRNLELLDTHNPEGVALVKILDRTLSPMGARMLKKWIVLPLKEQLPIEERLNVVNFFVNNTEIASSIIQEIKKIGDLERIISKVALARINPRELVQLKRALEAIEPIKDICNKVENEHLKKISEQLNPCKLIKDRIEKEIKPDPSVLINKGNLFNEGVSASLDELRKIAYSGKDYLLQIQQREIKNTGITSLKIAYTSVFGYYIEVTNVHKNKVPQSWIRKQTLVNSERYITEELKQYEEKILTAEEKILELEIKLFTDFIISVSDYIQPIQQNALLIGRLDCLLSFANIASKNNYVCPEINNTNILEIKNGRHPVIEQTLPIGDAFIPNDIYLDDESQQIIIITGPNMSGKSAVLRQTALIVLMAQIGSFVPAASAKIGIIDKIFTRVGASDNISSGESTFMIEMNETASILHNISNRSLILLDEIGRGTSTYDGISIAWAIAEYLHNHKNAKPKVLFATHYHELNEIASNLMRIKNYNVAIKETANKVIFIRKLVPGGSEHSFGIHVAKMAGIPLEVIERANEILSHLEKQRGNTNTKTSLQNISKDTIQLSMFKIDDPLLLKIKQHIQNIDLNTLTPIEALMKLDEIKKMINKN